jgi:hypothetical protein
MNLLWMMILSISALAEFVPRIPTRVFNKLVLEANRFYYATPTIEISLPDLKKLEFELPEGGGEFDFSQHIDFGQHQMFSLKFKFDFHADYTKNIRVFFVSRYKPVSSSGLVFGAKCSTVYELSRNFREGGRFLKGGLELSVMSFRYLNTIGGDWYFAFESEGETYVSMVRFLDKRSDLVMCVESK